MTTEITTTVKHRRARLGRGAAARALRGVIGGACGKSTGDRAAAAQGRARRLQRGRWTATGEISTLGVRHGAAGALYKVLRALGEPGVEFSRQLRLPAAKDAEPRACFQMAFRPPRRGDGGAQAPADACTVAGGPVLPPRPACPRRRLGRPRHGRAPALPLRRPSRPAWPDRLK